MKKLIAFMLPLFVIFGAESQILIKDAHAVSRSVDGPFHGVQVSGAIDVILSQGDEVALAVSAETEAQRNDIVTEVKNGILQIHLQGYGMRSRHYGGKMRAYLSFKKLDLIDASGACDVVLQEKMKADQLKLVLSGASSFSGVLEVEHVKASLSGACNVNLKKSTIANLDASLSGASSLKNIDAVIQKADLKCSGASEARLTVLSVLRASGSGASSIHYKGDPQIEHRSISGVSSLKKID